MSSLVRRKIGDHPQMEVSAEVILPAAATLAVLLRVILRRKNGIGLWWDDYTIILFLPLIWTMWAVFYHIAHNLLDPETKAPKPESLREYYLCTYVTNSMFNIALIAVKLSVLLLYKRAFGVTRMARRVIYALIAFNIAPCIAAFFGTIFDCTPARDYWENPANCTDDGPRMILFFKVIHLFEFFADVLLVLFPIPFVWRMRSASIGQKIAVTVVFSLGVVSCIGCAMRMYLLFEGFKQIVSLSITGLFNLLIVAELLELCVATVAISVTAVHAPLSNIIRGWINTIRRIEEPPRNHHGTSNVAQNEVGADGERRGSKKDEAGVVTITTLGMTTECRSTEDLEMQAATVSPKDEPHV